MPLRRSKIHSQTLKNALSPKKASPSAPAQGHSKRIGEASEPSKGIRLGRIRSGGDLRKLSQGNGENQAGRLPPGGEKASFTPSRHYKNYRSAIEAHNSSFVIHFGFLRSSPRHSQRHPPSSSGQYRGTERRSNEEEPGKAPLQWWSKLLNLWR